MSLLVEWAERGLVPDPALRLAIRHLVAQRLREERALDLSLPGGSMLARVEEMRRGPIALVPDLANVQHYEVPSRFFELVLGRRMKYSCCTWPEGVRSLDEAEEAALAQVAERARLADGQRILELGCGWGSLTLWLAERFPSSRILAISNAKSQREHVLRQAEARGLANVEVETVDANAFDTDLRFDRVISVEMFEHLRNWERMLERVAGWLDEGGRAFFHVFCHARYAYPYESRPGSEGAGDWMAREFFSGGMMPSADLFLHFQRDLLCERRWMLPGTHYQRTAEAWLERLDARRDDALHLFAEHRQGVSPERAVGRWRLFFLACAELFGHRAGSEWGVGHYAFAKRR